MISNIAGRQHASGPTTVAPTVVGLKYDGGVMLAADTMADYAGTMKFKDTRRLVEINKVLIGASGEISDFQEVIEMLKANALEEECNSSLYEDHSSNARETWNYLRSVVYNRRSKMNPLYNQFLIAGRDEKGKAFLGWIDKIGTCIEESMMATGFGHYLVMALLREKYRPDLQEGEARALLEDCMRVLFYRDCYAINRIQIAKVDEESGEVLISDPYEVETEWDFAAFSGSAAHFDGDGGW